MGIFLRHSSQTTRSTKLSYAPNMQRVVYHGFCSRASLGSARGSRAAIGGLANRSSSFVSNVLTPNLARVVFPLRVRLRFAGLRNQLLDRVRSALRRNISNRDAKNRVRSRWRRDASQTTPSVSSLCCSLHRANQRAFVSRRDRDRLDNRRQAGCRDIFRGSDQHLRVVRHAQIPNRRELLYADIPQRLQLIGPLKLWP